VATFNDRGPIPPVRRERRGRAGIGTRDRREGGVPCRGDRRRWRGACAWSRIWGKRALRREASAVEAALEHSSNLALPATSRRNARMDARFAAEPPPGRVGQRAAMAPSRIRLLGRFDPSTALIFDLVATARRSGRPLRLENAGERQNRNDLGMGYCVTGPAFRLWVLDSLSIKDQCMTPATRIPMTMASPRDTSSKLLETVKCIDTLATRIDTLSTPTARGARIRDRSPRRRRTRSKT
jgi:hypothetical protein